MKKTVTLIFIFFTINGFSQIQRDKVLHFLGGNLFGLAGAGIAKQLSDGNRFWTFAGAVGGATLIGLGKEAVDAGQREGGWDNDDLLATVLGGITVGVTIDLFTNYKRNKKPKATNALEDVPIQMQFKEIHFASDTDATLPSLTKLSLSDHVIESLQ